MNNFIKLDLETINGNNIHLNKDYLKPYQEEIIEFLDGQDYMKTLKFAKSMMMSQEIKSNNSVEGINDNLSIIDKVIQERKSNLSNQTKQRIINLYHGYQYILNNETIDKEHLKELYQLLSDGILEKYDKENMGEYYRNAPVYILKGGRLNDKPFMGVGIEKIDYFMNKLFEFINNEKTESDEIDIFIKSQIIHFYFVYIHPYFDVNGRTSRTISMWYLLNNKNYPYIIFNRAIAFNKKEYISNIIKGRHQGDITLFLKYILISVERELEKEYLINNIKETSTTQLSKEDTQILEYLLTMKGNLTAKDLIYIYKNYNEHQKPNIIFEEKILPLIDKSIILNKGYTKGIIMKNMPNMNISINPNIVDINPKKVKHLNINRFIK